MNRICCRSARLYYITIHEQVGLLFRAWSCTWSKLARKGSMLIADASFFVLETLRPVWG